MKGTDPMDYTDIIFERKLYTLKGAVNIVIDFETTTHSDERKFRHGDGTEIKDEDIVLVCKKAIPKITKDLFLDKIQMTDELLLIEARTGMNVICQLRGKELSALKLVVITVMVKHNFRPKSGTITYEV